VIKITRQQKITLGEMRASGVCGLLIYCADYKSSHWIRMSADQWSDDVRLSDLEDRFEKTEFELSSDSFSNEKSHNSLYFRLRSKLAKPHDPTRLVHSFRCRDCVTFNMCCDPPR
jgi:hypothetical protein